MLFLMDKVVFFKYYSRYYFACVRYEYGMQKKYVKNEIQTFFYLKCLGIKRVR